MTQFEDKFMEVQASMISLALEYVQNQAEKVYIYCISEEALQSYKVFYKINGIVIEMDKVNEVATNKIDDSDNMAFALLEYGAEDIQKLIDVCQEYNHEHPTEMWLIYDNIQNKVSGKYSYDLFYSNSDTLTADDIFEQWYKETKEEVKGHNDI